MPKSAERELSAELHCTHIDASGYVLCVQPNTISRASLQSSVLSQWANVIRVSDLPIGDKESRHAGEKYRESVLFITPRLQSTFAGSVKIAEVT